MKNIQIDTDNDLLFFDGTLQIGVTKEQETKLILISVPGNWKESPLLGVDLYSEIHTAGGTGALKSRIRKQLKADGKTISNIRFDSNELILE